MIENDRFPARYFLPYVDGDRRRGRGLHQQLGSQPEDHHLRRHFGARKTRTIRKASDMEAKETGIRLYLKF